MIKFDRFKFYPLKKKWELTYLLDLVKDFIINKSISENITIKDIYSLTNPIENTLIFVEKKNKLDNRYDLNSLLIFDDFDNFNLSKNKNKILVNEISKIYSKIINMIFYHEDHNDFTIILIL